MAKAKRAKRKTVERIVDRLIRPTEPRQAHNDFASAGAAWRATPVIDTLRNAGKLTAAEHDRLSFYRDQASRAEDDIARSSTLAPERMMGGNGGGTCTTGPIPAALLFTPAIAETSRIERDLGDLREFVRAVAVDDTSLTRWCIAKYGGRERYDGDGRFIAMVPLAPEKRDVIGMALLDLKFAAGRIVK